MNFHRWCLLATTLIIFGCVAIPTTRPAPTVDLTCTAVGCGFTLQVGFAGEAPSDYVLTAASSTGETLVVHCQNGAAVYDAQTTSGKSPTCSSTGVSFLNFSPEQVTITVHWGASEVSQSFQPAYHVSYPNGSGCEPECRSAQVKFDITEGWKTYSDPVHGFSFKYPDNLEVLPIPNTSSLYVGEQIQVDVSGINPLDCRGDCPVIESTETITLASLEAAKVRGYIGSVGGNIPQQYLSYILHRENFYFSFTLYALSKNATANDPSTIRPLEKDAIALFERIMETFKITSK